MNKGNKNIVEKVKIALSVIFFVALLMYAGRADFEAETGYCRTEVVSICTK